MANLTRYDPFGDLNEFKGLMLRPVRLEQQAPQIKMDDPSSPEEGRPPGPAHCEPRHALEVDMGKDLLLGECQGLFTAFAVAGRGVADGGEHIGDNLPDQHIGREALAFGPSGKGRHDQDRRRHPGASNAQSSPVKCGNDLSPY